MSLRGCWGSFRSSKESLAKVGIYTNVCAQPRQAWCLKFASSALQLRSQYSKTRSGNVHKLTSCKASKISDSPWAVNLPQTDLILFLWTQICSTETTVFRQKQVYKRLLKRSQDTCLGLSTTFEVRGENRFFFLNYHFKALPVDQSWSSPAWAILTSSQDLVD